MYDARIMDGSIEQIRPGEGRLAHAEPDHPPVPPARIGVVLANLGTPDAPDGSPDVGGRPEGQDVLAIDFSPESDPALVAPGEVLDVHAEEL